MQSIVYQDKTGGKMFIFNPKYPEQRSLNELKRTERIITAIKELEHMANINVFLYKRNKLRLISSHNF
jgi:hypothetical protein